MKKALFAASIALALSGIASAGIVGSAGLTFHLPGIATIGSAGNSIIDATGFDMTSGLDVSSETGDFTTYTGPSSSLTGDTFTVAGPFNETIFSDSNFGTFVATQLFSDVIFDDPGVGQNDTRQITYVGTFTPGSAYSPSQTVNSASLVISLNQSGGPGDAISGGLTLHTPNNVGTPEPATMAMIGGALIGLASLRRKKA